MERYQQKFVEESKELLGNLESSLLILEDEPSNKSVIEEIFRIMHSLKGSGAMFGFTKISQLTHHLEDIFSSIRAGKLSVSKHLIDLTFSSIDLIRENLKGASGGSGDLLFEELSEKIQSITRHKIDTPSYPSGKQCDKDKKQDQSENRLSAWLINFQPAEDILREGNNPVYIFDELAGMGHCIAQPLADELPDNLSDFKPELLYLSWNILLVTKETAEDINNVFLFVQESSNIHINKIADRCSPIHDQQISLIKKILCNPDPELEKLTQIFQEQKGTEQLNPEVQPELKAEMNSPVEFRDKDEITIRVPSSKLDILMNLVSELITAQGQLTTLADELGHANLNLLSEKNEKLIRQLREQSMEMSLVSINTLTVRFKRLVRDLSKELGKEVNLTIIGGETELDKTIIEHLSEPILHIIRNSIDHGIESPALRIQQGKAAAGEIKLKAFYSGSEVHIEISDDGRGIDSKIVLQKARELNLIEASGLMNQEDIYKLLFKPGFSTKNTTSEYSGRGVGMDVVYRKIADLRGDIEINSKEGMGTRILIKLPLTLTIMDGMLTQVGQTKYILPIASVRKIFEVSLSDLTQSFNKLIKLDGQHYPFLILGQEFEHTDPEAENLQLILVEYEEKKIGLVVDQILGERQVVLKPLGRALRNNKMFSGGSILGDGQIALVLDTNKLVREYTAKSIKEQKHG